MRLSSSAALVAALALLPCAARAQAGRLAPNAPQDRPVSAETMCHWNLMQKAIEPYVAQARATYPAARREFLDSTRARRPMFVTTRLKDARGVQEQVFVAVDSIVGSRIYGRLASQIGAVQGYRYGQPHSLEESQLVDWMFANPDGSEEGNVVGKFMETYVPPRNCRES